MKVFCVRREREVAISLAAAAAAAAAAPPDLGDEEDGMDLAAMSS